MDLNVILLIALTISAFLTVLGSSLIRSVIGLAVTSVVLTVIMFRLDSPIAAIFELSVCAGLITAVFISAISVIMPLSNQELAANKASRKIKYAFLLPLIIAVGVALLYIDIPSDIIKILPGQENDVRRVIWFVRQFDLIGQLAILLVGVFAVKVLYKEKPSAEPENKDAE